MRFVQLLVIPRRREVLRGRRHLQLPPRRRALEVRAEEILPRQIRRAVLHHHRVLLVLLHFPLHLPNEAERGSQSARVVGAVADDLAHVLFEFLVAVREFSVADGEFHDLEALVFGLLFEARNCFDVERLHRFLLLARDSGELALEIGDAVAKKRRRVLDSLGVFAAFASEDVLDRDSLILFDELQDLSFVVKIRSECESGFLSSAHVFLI